MSGKLSLVMSATALVLVTACSQQSDAPGSGNDAPTSTPDRTNDPAIYRGAAIASQVCGQCHDTSAGAVSTQTFSAPSFASIANRPGMTSEKLEDWLTSSHPSMPNYVFDAATVKDLTAYVLILRRPP
jgi:hypothetical protein